MTAAEHLNDRLNDRRTGVIVDLVAFAVMTLVVILPVDFFLNYAVISEAATRAGHLRFLFVAAVAALALSAWNAVWVERRMLLSSRRCAGGSLLITVSVFLLVGAGYAALSLSPALDPAVGAEWSNTMCGVLASALAVSAVLAFASGRRMLLLRQG